MKPDTTGRANLGRALPPERNTAADTSPSGPQPAGKSRLWVWFVLAFVLQLGAWVAWFVIADQHRVETVPLVSGGTPK